MCLPSGKLSSSLTTPTQKTGMGLKRSSDLSLARGQDQLDLQHSQQMFILLVLKGFKCGGFPSSSHSAQFSLQILNDPWYPELFNYNLSHSSIKFNLLICSFKGCTQLWLHLSVVLYESVFTGCLGAFSPPYWLAIWAVYLSSLAFPPTHLPISICLVSLCPQNYFIKLSFPLPRTFPFNSFLCE